MEARISEIKNSLKSKMESHPNLVKIWTNYIHIKKTKFEKDLEQCERLLENIDNIDDPSPEEMLLKQSVANMVLVEHSLNISR